jgi:hypothetical protein
MEGFTTIEVPQLPADPNSGNFSIAGIGSFGSLNISGNITVGGNELVISVIGSNLNISVVGVGSTALTLS